jgi:4'-phosphopantetheinyl transferase EntD
LNFIEQIIDGGIRVTYLPRDQGIAAEQILSGLSGPSRSRLKDLVHPARREEFLRARYLVRQALRSDTDPARDGDDVIIWPAGKRGSVSHTLGHVGIALADSTTCASLGFDIEHASRVKPVLREKICTPRELALVDSGKIQLVDVFCAKEAIFKSHFPLGRKRFWFLDAEIVDVQSAPGDAGPVRQNLEIKVLNDTGPRTPAGSITRVILLDTPLSGCVAAIAALSAVHHGADSGFKRL